MDSVIRGPWDGGVVGSRTWSPVYFVSFLLSEVYIVSYRSLMPLHRLSPSLHTSFAPNLDMLLLPIMTAPRTRTFSAPSQPVCASAQPACAQPGDGLLIPFQSLPQLFPLFCPAHRVMSPGRLLFDQPVELAAPTLLLLRFLSLNARLLTGRLRRGQFLLRHYHAATSTQPCWAASGRIAPWLAEHQPRCCLIRAREIGVGRRQTTNDDHQIQRLQ